MKVIVVGGGIGGLAAAIGLRRSGHHVKIFERSSFLREVGAAINVCPNASRVLRDWGFDTNRARMVEARRTMVAVGSSLHKLIENDCSSCEHTYGAPWYLAHRVDLHSELRRVATDDAGLGIPVEIALRSEVTGYNTDLGSVTLSDSSVHHADLVIAADGVHSTAVKQIIGHSTPPQSTGSAAFRFLISTEEIKNDLETAAFVENGANDGLMRVLVSQGLRRLVWYPCADNTVQNFVGIHPDEQAGSQEKEDWDQSVSVETLLSHYSDFHPSILNVIKKAVIVKRWPLLYRDPIPTWHRGRVVLVGDAAHPMLPHQGQGGAQAIEDAAALSEVFTNLPPFPSLDEIQSRLALYEKIRINRASAMQIFSNAGQDESWKIREQALPFMPEGVEVPTSPAEFQAHNFGYDVVKDSKLKMGELLQHHKAAQSAQVRVVEVQI